MPRPLTEEIFESICQKIEETSYGTKHHCEKHDVSVGSFYRFMDSSEARLERYARAKDRQADNLVEEMIDICDDGSNDLMTIEKGDISYEQENKEVVNRSRLRIDTRKWIAAKLKPKRYGDKLDLTTGGSAIKPFVIELSDETDTEAN